MVIFKNASKRGGFEGGFNADRLRLKLRKEIAGNPQTSAWSHAKKRGVSCLEIRNERTASNRGIGSHEGTKKRRAETQSYL